MKILNLDHVGIAVNSLEETLKFYEEVLGLKCVGEEVVEDQQVKVAFLPVGDTELEFLESTTEDGPIAKFIAKNSNRGGIQHVALRVEYIEEAIAEVKANGYRLIDETPRYGAGNAKIAFCHPKGTDGVLLELSERE